MLAAEYVLGLLEGEALLRARGMLARDLDFAEDVARWEAHFAPLMDGWEAREPSPDVWHRIHVATSGATPAAPIANLEDLRRSRNRWRMFGGLSATAAAAFALVMVLGPGPDEALPVTPTNAPLLAANIPIGDTSLRLALTYVPGQDAISVSSAGLTADGVHDHELWLVDKQGDLHSLGVIDPGSEARLSVEPGLAADFRDGAQLVLTREPLGGKPDDADAGPVVAEGTFTAI
ncbi:hypothetical protein D6201_06715 [Aurantiacibacter aquimixticola]|uniref:Anti-sigma K factor RskA C-terminal domain-containing protein n=2 Tax=Aurantiacibacter aquimixticola TaxID=1958945 RepID=A0A419RWU9_9SPHN|nr:hypothetical protein D6201_06715 [Aurantiacibacter aquimixticola]